MTSTSPIITFIIRFAFLDQVTKVLFKWKHITQISRKIILERSFQIVATNKYSKITSFEQLSEIRLIRIWNLTREKTIMLFPNCLLFVILLHLGDSIMVKFKFYWNDATTIVTLTFNTDFSIETRTGTTIVSLCSHSSSRSHFYIFIFSKYRVKFDRNFFKIICLNLDFLELAMLQVGFIF